jgi:DUF3102 family protein
MNAGGSRPVPPRLAMPPAQQAQRLTLAAAIAELPQLVPRIQKHLAAAKANYRAAGLLLIRAKELLPHGVWGQWLKENFALTDRTARLYMELAESKSETISEMKASKIRRQPSPVALVPTSRQGRSSATTEHGDKPDQQERAVQEFMQEIISRGYASLLPEIQRSGEPWMSSVLDSAREALLFAVFPQEGGARSCGR